MEKDKAEEKIKKMVIIFRPRFPFHVSLSFRHVFLSFSFYSSCICEKLDSVGLSIVDRNKNFLRLPFELMSVGLHAEEHARK